MPTWFKVYIHVHVYTCSLLTALSESCSLLVSEKKRQAITYSGLY